MAANRTVSSGCSTAAEDELFRFTQARLAMRREREVSPPSIEELRRQYEDANKSIQLPHGCACLKIGTPGGSGELLTPESAKPERALLFHHGGGHIFGSPLSHRHFVARLADQSGMQGFNLSYRLAPEHPFPAGLDDVVANYEWLLEQGFQASNVVIAGDSAGGNLTAALALSLKEVGLPTPAGMYLLSPWLDLDPARQFPQHRADVDVVLSPEFLHGCAEAYVGDRWSHLSSRISPLHADLQGLCPLFIQVGSHDLLLDDAVRFATKAAAADVRVRLDVWPRAPHVWPIFHPTLKAWGCRAITEAAKWIEQCVRNDL